MQRYPYNQDDEDNQFKQGPPSWEDYHERHKPFVPEPPEGGWPNMPRRWCLLCGMHTLIPLCWFLFMRRHDGCKDYACYNCLARTRNGFWYLPETSVIHEACGNGDKI